MRASDLVPPEFQHLLMHYAEESDKSAWGIGDVTNTLEEELVTVPAIEIYKAVAQFCNKHFQTVRDYAYTSRNVPVQIRRQYDMFGRHHLKAMIPHVDEHGGWDALCNEVLEWGDDFGGNLIPVHALRARLAENGLSKPMWQRRLRQARSRASKITEDAEAPDPLRGVTKGWLSETEKWDA